MWRTAVGVCIGILLALGIVAGGAVLLRDDTEPRRPPVLTPEDMEVALTTP